MSSEDEAMVALKEAIEAEDGYAVKVADLPALVRYEHQVEELTEAKVIELSARKLEELSAQSDLTVVFGKSAMLAGGVGRKDVLFINPKYDSEWPWKKQYYADEKLAGKYNCDKYEKLRSRKCLRLTLWISTRITTKNSTTSSKTGSYEAIK